MRFPTPVKVGVGLRMSATVASCQPAERGVVVEIDAVVEVEGSAKPACVARSVLLFTTA